MAKSPTRRRRNFSGLFSCFAPAGRGSSLSFSTAFTICRRASSGSPASSSAAVFRNSTVCGTRESYSPKRFFTCSRGMRTLFLGSASAARAATMSI